MKEIREYLSSGRRLALAIAGIIGGVLVNFSGPILLKFAPLNQSLAVTDSVLKVVGHILLASSMAVCLYLSIVIARSNGFTGKRIATIAFFFIFSVVAAVMSYKICAAYNNFVQYTEAVSSDMSKEIRTKLSAATSAEKRSKLAYLNAQYVFEEEGKLITYVDRNGTEHKYQPDEETIKNRETHLFFKALIKMQNQTMVANILIWILSTLIAIVLSIRRDQVTRST